MFGLGSPLSVSTSRVNLVAFLDFSVLCSLIVIFLTLYKYKWSSNAGKGRTKASYINEFPGPKPLPIVGNGHQMLFEPTEFYSWSWNLCKTWGDPMRLWRFNFPIFFVSSFETATFLLSKSNFVAKSKDVDLFWRLPGGNGLSSSPANIHRSRRKLLYPGYTRQVVERSIYVFCEESRKLVDKLESYAKSGETFEVLDLLMPCSFRIICRSAFGDHIMADKTDAEALNHTHALHTVSIKFTNRIMSPYLWLRNDFIYFNLTPEGRKLRECIKLINNFSTEVINRRRIERMEAKQQPPKSEAAIKIQPCYLDMLLDLQEKGDLQDSDILGELNNYIVAGYDTTALTIAWTLLALATNPRHHQVKIFEEVKDIIIIPPPGETNNSLTFSDTKEMKYLELCIKESLRLYPTSPALPRSTTEDMHLPDGRVIPSGSDVIIMLDMIHRDPRFFPKPEEFIPERHLERIPAFFPFSNGARNCIGQVYAMHQVKVELAYLIKEFIWETEERPETIPKLFQALMVPAEGIRFKISRRI